MTWRQPWCGFGPEATGGIPEADRIVTAAVVVFDGGRPARARAWIAGPGFEIPVGATAVHGCTAGAAREAGRPAAEVITEVEE